MFTFRRSSRPFYTLTLVRCMLALCLGVACATQPAAAQAPAAPPSYTWDTVGADYADPGVAKNKEIEKNNIIMGRGGAGALATLDSWYTQYLFPSMAMAEHFADLAQKRFSLATDLERASEPNLHQHLLDLAYDEAVQRVTGNYHPFVRYNAMLIIGNLNQTEEVNLNGVVYPAVRLSKALDFMVDQLKVPDQAFEIKLGAVIGIWRHLYLVRERSADQPIPDGRRAEIASLMKALLDEKTVPAGVPESMHTWLRRRAADVLSKLGEVGDNRGIFDSLVRIVGDAEEPLSLRCAAADALGYLKYAEVTGVDALATARLLGALAAFACRAEDTRAKDEQKSLEEELMRNVRGTGYSGMGGMPGYMGPPSGGSGRRPGAGSAAPGGGSAGGSSSGMGMGMGIGMPDGGLGGEGSAMPGGGGYLGSGGGYGMGGGASTTGEDDEMKRLIEGIRRRLKYPLACALMGVRGPEQKTTAGAAPVLGAVGSLAADDPQKAEIMKIVKALGEIVKATDAHKNGLAKMLDEVRDKTRELEKLLPNVAAAAGAPAADDDLPGAVVPPEAGAPAGQTPPASGQAPAGGATPPAGASDPAKKAGKKVG